MRISDWSSDVCSSDLHPCRPASYDQYRSFCICGRQTIVAHFAFPPDIGIDRAPHTPFRTEQHSDATLIAANARSEEHTSELQSLMRISYAVFCLKKKMKNKKH